MAVFLGGIKVKKVKMLTVVPANLAATLAKDKKIADYNTLPQLNATLLSFIREYMTMRVGYANLPMACLCCMRNGTDALSGEDILSRLPVNSKNSVLFQLEMPEDMIVSIDFDELLEISDEISKISEGDTLTLEFTKDKLFDSLVLGIEESLQDPISFIPFLARDRCKFYAKFDSNFDSEGMDLPGLERIDVRELTSFLNY